MAREISPPPAATVPAHGSTSSASPLVRTRSVRERGASMAREISPAAAPATTGAFSSDGGLHEQQDSLNPQPVDGAPHISSKLKSKVEMALPCASSESDFMHVPKKTRCSPRKNKCAVKPTVNHNGPMEKSKRACKKELKLDNENAARVETYRCNPSRLSSIVALLSPDQKIFVADAIFDRLLSMQACNIPRGMTMWLIRSVNCSAGTLKIGGKSIPIKLLVEKVIGAPSGPIPVELSRYVDLNLKNKFTVKGRGQPVHITIPQMFLEKRKYEFTILFMLVALCVYLAPMANLSVNRDYLGALINVKKISDMNWCEHIADFLIQGISDFKTNKKDNVYVRGCVHILNVIFMDCVASYYAPQDIPRILHVTTTHLLAVNLLAVNKSSGKIDYDSLQIKEIENTVYCDETTYEDGNR